MIFLGGIFTVNCSPLEMPLREFALHVVSLNIGTILFYYKPCWPWCSLKRLSKHFYTFFLSLTTGPAAKAKLSCINNLTDWENGPTDSATIPSWPSSDAHRGATRVVAQP